MSGPGGHPSPDRPRVPRLARALVRMLVAAEDRPFVEADLEERFRAVARKRGAGAARRWYWWQVARGLPTALHRDPRGLQGSGAELRRALRALRRRPLYALGVAGTMAVGLASAAAVASVAWTVWLAPMPYPDPDRVVRLYELLPPTGGQASARDVDAEAGGVRWQLSPPVVEDMRAHDWTTLEAVAGVSRDNVVWEGEGGRVRLTGVLASPEVGRILGLRPVVGGLLSDDADAAEVVLTPAFWERAFGGDPSVVGRTLRLDGVEHRVVGVAALPEGYPRPGELLLPLRFPESELVEGMRGARYLDGIGRVAPGHTAAEASAEVATFFRSLGERHSIHEGSGGSAVVLGDDLVEPYTGILSLLLAAGLTFLTLALVNVAGLVAARRVESRQDRWVRLALGATRGRLLRATAVEGTVLGAGAAAAGLLGAWALLGPIGTLVPSDIPRIGGLGLDLPVAGAVVAAGLLGGLLVGLLGHALTREADPSAARRGGGRGASAPGLGGRRLLVVGQVALTTLLFSGGLVILARVGELQEVELGFEPEGVVGSLIVLEEGRYPSNEARAALWRSLEEAAEARGVEATVAVNPPMGGSTMTFGVRRDEASEQVFAQFRAVSPGYFRTLGTAIREGRALGEEDGAGGEPVVVVDEALASELFPEGGAVGQVITVVSTPRTVVGVAEPTRHFGPDTDAPPGMYVPLAQDPWQLGHLLVGDGGPNAAAVLRAAVAEVDPGLGMQTPTPYTRHVEEWYAPLRLQTLIVGVLAAVGGLLATLGLYALVAFHVTSRRREIGIRMALGAPGGRLFGRVVAQGLVLAGAGMALGLGAWYAVLPLTLRFLEGADAGGAWVPLIVVALVGTAALAATLLPAWRSTAVDPVTTLAAE